MNSCSDKFGLGLVYLAIVWPQSAPCTWYALCKLNNLLLIKISCFNLLGLVITSSFFWVLYSYLLPIPVYKSLSIFLFFSFLIFFLCNCALRDRIIDVYQILCCKCSRNASFLSLPGWLDFCVVQHNNV